MIEVDQEYEIIKIIKLSLGHGTHTQKKQCSGSNLEEDKQELYLDITLSKR